MSGDNDSSELDLRTTPRSYRRGGVWIFVTIVLILAVVAFAWTQVRDAMIETPKITSQSASTPSSTDTGQ
ncbi:hypothetical protein [Rhizobium grahamii]|uniref:Transmembrane protein n=1 Tax=Rhizobium grahamii CCGE 502 TaxID=990285 RepID=S3HE60_9HYPH|nr:hypothetical protein [Rhizobium grahamii]EPE97014.1 hypothetical protein RGCCGE502_17290 [Rhizobium grahamii CCGE 502]